MILLIAFSGKVKLQKIEHYYWLKYIIFKDAETTFQTTSIQILIAWTLLGTRGYHKLHKMTSSDAIHTRNPNQSTQIVNYTNSESI